MDYHLQCNESSYVVGRNHVAGVMAIQLLWPILFLVPRGTEPCGKGRIRTCMLTFNTAVARMPHGWRWSTVLLTRDRPSSRLSPVASTNSATFPKGGMCTTLAFDWRLIHSYPLFSLSFSLRERPSLDHAGPTKRFTRFCAG